VRSVIVTPKPVAAHTVAGTVVAPRVVPDAAPVAPPPAAPRGIDDTVSEAAARHGLPPQLIDSVIKVESGYDPFAISPKGALGLMQLIPSTARRFGVANVFDPAQNIEGGAKYLKYLLDLYNGNYPLALAAYNAGEGAVAKYGGVPPYKETRDYLISVEKQLQKQKPAAPAPPPVKPVAPPSGPAHIQEIVEPDGTVRYVNR
jgi:soluble lytic murein transglycosylase-like protein